MGKFIPNKQGLQKMNDSILNQWSANAIKGAKDMAPIKTGKLHNSIREVEKKPDSRRIAAETDYSAYVEYGTSKQSPQPFMRPAARRGVRGIKI